MWWLSVFFFIGSQWVPGDQVEPQGWSPRAFATEQECRERKAFAERQCLEAPLNHKALWYCSKDNPVLVPPDEASLKPCNPRLAGKAP